MALRYVGSIISIIDSEIDLIKTYLPLDCGIQSKPINKAIIQTRFHWDATKTDLIEFIVGIVGSKIIKQHDGMPITYSQAIAYFSKLFDVSLNKFYDRKSEVLARKTLQHPLFDRMIAAYSSAVDYQDAK